MPQQSGSPFTLFRRYLVASNYKWKMGQIFVAFLEYLNFKNDYVLILKTGHPKKMPYVSR